MNYKSPVFRHYVDDFDPKVLSDYKVRPAKKGTFVFQICDKGMYFRSFTYSILSFLKNSNIGEYNVTVVVYGHVKDSQTAFYKALQSIGVAVYFQPGTFTSKCDFILEGYCADGTAVLLDVDTYLLTKFDVSAMLENRYGYAASPVRINPKNLEELIRWKTGRSLADFKVCLSKHPLLKTVVLDMDLWVGGYCVSLSEKFYSDKRVSGILRFLKNNGIHSDELGFGLACRACGYSTGPLGVDVYLDGDLSKKNALAHWSPLFDEYPRNGRILKRLVDEKTN
jgi:hypothetical protein